MSGKDGYVVYEGPSLIDGALIVGIVTVGSANAKTGDVGTLWVFRGDEDPTVAVRSGGDVSVCGLCPHRGRDALSEAVGGVFPASQPKDRTCYVVLHQGPLTIYRAWRGGKYQDARVPGSVGHKGLLRALRWLALRVTGYGEGTALPYGVVEPFLVAAQSVLGYTHRWDSVVDSRWCQWLMASVESENKARLAQGLGWRTFRVGARWERRSRSLREADCPYPGTGLQCRDCRRCGGLSSGGRGSVFVHVHGGGKSEYIVKRFEARLAG